MGHTNNDISWADHFDCGEWYTIAIYGHLLRNKETEKAEVKINRILVKSVQ